MNKTGTKRTVKSKPKLDSKEKIEQATLEFRKLMDEIKPFIKERKIKKYSTTREWKASNI